MSRGRFEPRRICSLRYEFGEFSLDTERRELHRGPDSLAIAPQVFDLLEYLIRNRTRVVSKDDLIAAIWNGRIVSDAALTTRLNAVRAAIGDSGDEQRLIKTLPRKGFRFVGAVRDPQPLPGQAVAGQAGDPPSGSAGRLPDKPSIAVLPFTNLSSDPEQDYFADGIVEDITMALSLFRWLFVIARNSSFTYKGRPVDVKQVGRELGVRYVLQGSVRKAGDRIRIAGQLIDAESGTHIWADHFEGLTRDMFDLQDYLTSSVVGAIAPKLQTEEIKRARRKPTDRLDAYDYYLRGLAKASLSKTTNSEALQLFRRAMELDPRLACAYGMAAWCYVRRKALGWTDDPSGENAEATQLARKAVELGTDDPFALCMGAYALVYMAKEFDHAAALMDRALDVNPNLARAWMLSAWLRVWRGEPELVLAHAAHAVRLSPRDPVMCYTTQSAVAYAHYLTGRYDLAMACADNALRDNPIFLLNICISAASNALTGQRKTAQRAVAHALECRPTLRLSNLGELTSFRRPDDLARFTLGLREAGLPE